MGIFGMWKNRRRGGLIENTVMLSIMEFSNLALGFVTSGYQMRVLGLDNSGFLAYVLYIMVFFQLFIDFGFIQSAPGKIARRQKDEKYLSRILTCVTIIKLLFFGISVIVLFCMLLFFEVNGLQYLTYWLCLLQVTTNSLLPDYMYRGMEKMSVITVRTVLIKLFAVVMLFLFVRENDQYYLVPLFTIIANVGAIIFVYMHLFLKMKIPFCRVTVRDILVEIKDSSRFFFSRIASTTYSTVNGLIIGQKSLAGTAEYNRADTIIGAAKKGLLSPVADSMYPHMMRTRNFSVIKKTLKITMPILILGCAGVFLLAEPICLLWLGADGIGVVLPLRALMPIVIITLPSYILGFPTLGAMGLSKQVNNSTIYGTILHVAMLGTAYFTGNMNMLTLCILTCITELFILLYRITVVYRNRRLMYETPEAPAEKIKDRNGIEPVPDDISGEDGA